MRAAPRVRRALVGDAEAIARVQVRSWQAAHRGDLPAELLARLSVDDRARGWRAALAGAEAGDADAGDADAGDADAGDADAGDAALTLVAERRRRVVGFAHVGPAGGGHEEDGGGHRRGWLHALYVDPAAWGRGVGRALVEAGLAALAADGCREADLWVIEGNERGRRFYEAGGWAAEGSAKTELYGGTPVRLVRYRRALPGRLTRPRGRRARWGRRRC